jgi:glycosyltransferase involved in cell wall biosynthesis
MKVCYLCSDVDVQLLGHQGCSVHIREFTNALVESGHDVFIICAWLGDAAELAPRARVYDLQPSGANKQLWESLYDDDIVLNHHLERDLRSVFWTTWLQSDGAQILEREQPDFLYERYALFGLGGRELSRRFQIPHILELNAPLCDQQEGYLKFPLIQTARRLEPQIIRSTDAIVALTQWLADWAVGLGAAREKIHILPDAVSESHFRIAPSGANIRDRYQLHDRQVIGFVGSFHKWHDVCGLLDAFASIHQTRADRTLLLVGDGHDREKLQQQVQNLGLDEAVIFTGKVPHAQIPQYFAAMDVAVVPYQPIQDFFFSPMKLFESMAAGCPTIAADLGQIPQIVRHAQTGWLYSPGDITALVRAIELALDDDEESARIAHAARRYVLQNHTWKHVTDRVVDIATSLATT